MKRCLTLVAICAFSSFAVRAADVGPGGGEPGAAYLAYTRAFRKGDVKAIKRLMTVESAKAFDQAIDLLPIGRAIQPRNIEVVRGSINGNTATLFVRGTPAAPGAGGAGTVTMIKEGGEWKFAAESWPAAPLPSNPQPPPAVQPVTRGTPLPPDGGAPGDAWRAYDKAMNARDAAAIKKLLVRESAKKFDEVKDILDLVQGSRGTHARVTGGLMSGDRATLQLKGSPATLADITGSGRVTLVKENGAWKVAAEDWTPKP